MKRIVEIHRGAAEYSSFGPRFDAFVKGAEWADAHPHWISVKEQLPPADEDILAVNNEGTIYVASYMDFGDFKGFFANDDEGIKLNDVTHWMKLPALPKGGEK